MTVPEKDLAQWLVSGGDERLAVDPSTGLNMYGCSPLPRPDDIAFCSSTASTITADTASALETYRAEWGRQVAEAGEVAVYTRALDEIRAQLRDLLGMPDVDMIMAASGTDIHLFAALLFNHLDNRPLVTFTLMGNETGSAVPKAASGQHFMAQHADGATVKVGSEVGPGESIRNISFSVRNADSELRPEAELEDELSGRMAQAIANGERCLLIVADVSKTGLIAPGLESVFRLKAHFGDNLDILIDACQFRLSPATIRAYLRHNFLVAVTGSKFLSGPVFSGALLCPPKRAAYLKHRRLPAALADYCARADWPEGWVAKSNLPQRANFGLLLRWKAALIELDNFTALPEANVRRVVSAFATAVETRLSSDPLFAVLDQRPLDRSALGVSEAFDDLPTIFSFCLQHPVRGGFLTQAETAEVYRSLRTGAVRVQLGQPVASGADISALRLCLSAPLICQACVSDTALEQLIDRAMLALDQVAITVENLLRDIQGVAKGA